MKFAIQIQHDSQLAPVIQEMLGQALIQREEDFTTFFIEPKDPKAFWKALQPTITTIPGNVIVVCQGKFGWSDYRLLHSFTDEPLDTLE